MVDEVNEWGITCEEEGEGEVVKEEIKFVAAEESESLADLMSKLQKAQK